MKYVVDIAVYNTSGGYEYTETFDQGITENSFTAEEWNNALEYPVEPEKDEWLIIEVRFYNESDDPMFDNPVLISSYTVPVTEKEKEKESEFRPSPDIELATVQEVVNELTNKLELYKENHPYAINEISRMETALEVLNDLESDVANRD